MKTTTFSHHDAIEGSSGKEEPKGFFAGIAHALEAARNAVADRRMRSQLAELDNVILKDIGVDADEILRVRRKDQFTPRAWRR